MGASQSCRAFNFLQLCYRIWLSAVLSQRKRLHPIKDGCTDGSLSAPDGVQNQGKTRELTMVIPSN